MNKHYSVIEVKANCQATVATNQDCLFANSK